MYDLYKNFIDKSGGRSKFKDTYKIFDIIEEVEEISSKKSKKKMKIINQTILIYNIYQIEGVLGSGGFGNVYYAHRKYDWKLVAIKEINKTKIKDWIYSPIEKKTIPMELHVLQLSQNIKGVMKLHGYDLPTDFFLLVTETYERGLDLFSYISKKRYIEESLAKNIFRQVVSVVIKLLDEHNILHRDIKDENIVINPLTNEIMLIDFGYGCIINDKMKCSTILSAQGFIVLQNG